MCVLQFCVCERQWAIAAANIGECVKSYPFTSGSSTLTCVFLSLHDVYASSGIFLIEN